MNAKACNSNELEISNRCISLKKAGILKYHKISGKYQAVWGTNKKILEKLKRENSHMKNYTLTKIGLIDKPSKKIWYLGP